MFRQTMPDSCLLYDVSRLARGGTYCTDIIIMYILQDIMLPALCLMLSGTAMTSLTDLVSHENRVIEYRSILASWLFRTLINKNNYRNISGDEFGGLS